MSNHPKVTTSSHANNSSFADKVRSKATEDFGKKTGDEDALKVDYQTSFSLEEGSSCTSSVLKTEKQSQWVNKNTEVIRAKFEHLRIVTRLFAFDNWREIQKMLKIYFQAKIIINPLFDKNALISLDLGLIEDFFIDDDLCPPSSPPPPPSTSNRSVILNKFNPHFKYFSFPNSKSLSPFPSSIKNPGHLTRLDPKEDHLLKDPLETDPNSLFQTEKNRPLIFPHKLNNVVFQIN